MKTPTVKHSTVLAKSPCIPLLVDGWQELLRNHHADDRFPGVIQWDHEVFWIEIDGRPIAVLSFGEQKWRNTAWIFLSYVQPQYRRRGFYRKLYGALRREGRKRQWNSIETGIHLKNNPMRAAAKSLGRREAYSTWVDAL